MKDKKRSVFIEKVVEGQLTDLKREPKVQTEKDPLPKIHEHDRHGTPLVCLICSAKTKTKCSNCCMKFNRHFGICEK